MDTGPATRRIGERGVSSVQFVLASALALLLFVALANLVVFQYGKGALRSALEQGARAGSIGGAPACQATAAGVLSDLLGGRMSDDLTVACTSDAGVAQATGRARFPSWTPLMPDFDIVLVARAVSEP